MAFSTNAGMHAEHELWSLEHSRWKSDAEEWKKEVHKALDELTDIRGLLEEHDAALIRIFHEARCARREK